MEDVNPMNGRPPNNGPQGPDQPAYTIPGILNFIKHEWTRFEKERANWDAEKTELQAKIAFLEGERRGQENLKRDLVRRIKMLEYALKQERIKLHKLQYGKDLIFSEMKPPSFEGDNPAVDPLTENSRNDSRQLLRDCLREIGYTDALLDARASRIRHLRNITGLPAEPSNNAIVVPNNRQTRSEATEAENTTCTNQQQQQLQQRQHQHQPKSEVSVLTSQETITAKENDTGQEEPASIVVTETTAKPTDRPSSPPPHPVADEESLIAEAQESLEKSFEFLDNQDDSDSDSGSSADDESDENSSTSSSSRHKKSDSIETLALLPAETAVEHDLDHETEDAMLEFTSVSTHQESDFIETDMSSESGPDAPPSYHVAVASQEAKNKEQEWGKTDFAKMQEKYAQHVRRKKKPSARPCRTELERMKQFTNNQDDEFSGFSSNPPLLGNKGKSSPELEPYSRPKSPKQATGNPRYEKIEQSLGLGELKELTITNEADPLLGGTEPSSDEVQKTWFGRYTMRSHFDAVTSVAFHPSEAMLLTGSEDKTLKLWNLQRNGQTRKTAMIDVEPVLTLRGHAGSVLCVGTAMSGDVCFSADELGEVRIWQMPIEITDPFDAYDPKIHQGILKGHTDAVWDLVVHRDRDLLATCSSDGTCKIWNWKASHEPVISLTADPDYGVPTSADFVRSNPCQIVVSYTSSHAIVFDTETGKSILELNSTLTSDNTSATQINKVRCHPTLPVAVTAHEDKYLRFYDLTSGAVTHSMVAHGDAVSGIAIDPNGLYLLSSSHDGSLRFWNLDTKICIQDSITHRRRFDEAIFNVACHACKPFFASAGADGIAKVFI